MGGRLAGMAERDAREGMERVDWFRGAGRGVGWDGRHGEVRVAVGGGEGVAEEMVVKGGEQRKVLCGEEGESE
ncbi:hypothetical protein CYMTET_47441 [Cymbomonas tetramitiformis]|uniref:Uncharacterized protein n=1 Tax=Cymbomonas tetramitiformis TaxID=36881 RepID=A0AAE0EVZ9_9CHLO|nr:hypothetical protein CYMTET_47441 [Cymbomonas tetramitiformis]